MQLIELTNYIDSLLSADSFSDYCPNGLQVEGKTEVKKVITGVTACIELFDRAIERGADAIITHHGIFWDGQPVTAVGTRKERLARLLQNDISLLAWHLPLDAHAEVGNNAGISRELGLNNLLPFGKSKGQTIGFIGESEYSYLILQQLVKDTINPNSRFHSFGPGNISRVAVCSGGAPNFFPEAIAAGADAYITGEESEWVFHMAKEEKVHYICAGHHATEKFGVISLGNHLREKFGLDVEFVDIPNPI